MGQRSDVFEKFKEFEAMVTNVTGRTIKALRSDNGGEYTSKAFKNTLKTKEFKGSLQFQETLNKMG